MPNSVFQSFTIGKDMSLTIDLNNIQGGTVFGGVTPVIDVSDLGLLEDFSAKPTHSTIQAKPISHGGKALFRDKFEHWEGSFKIIRTGLGVDLLIQLLQDALLSATTGSVTAGITQTVLDPMGGAAGKGVFLFDNSTLTPDDAGSYTSEGVVVQSFTFRSPRRDILKATSTAPTAGTAQLATYLASIGR